MMIRLKAYLALIRFDKPVGTLLLLWPALWGLLLGGDGQPETHHVIIFVLGTFFMRSAGCAINDYADRNIDGKVARTQTRPLASGLIKPWEALLIAALMTFFSFILVLQTNELTVKLSFGAVALAGLYPFTKRWISSPQLVLGAAFAFAIPMGFSAEIGRVPLVSWGYFAVTVLWIFAYDTYYAMADREDDQFLGIGSTALLFGPYAAVVSFVLTLVFLAGFFGLLNEDIAFSPLVLMIGFCTSLGLALYQFYLARQFVPADCIKAFKTSNSIGLVISTTLFFGL